MSGLILQFAFDYTDENRQKLNEFKTEKDLEKYLLKQNTVEKFANYDPKPQGRRGNTGTLAFGLTLFGIGYMVVMIYLLLRQFVF